MSPTDPIADAAQLGIPTVRIEIMAVLKDRPGTISQIATATGYTRNGVAGHIDALLDVGVITCTVERLPGVPRPTRLFRLDPERVESLAWSLYEAIAEPENARAS